MKGFDVVHTGEIGMSTATDQELVEYARREGRTVITLDADFHALLALANATHPSVVRVRIQGLRTGAMVSVDEHSIRVRLLPLVR